MTKRLIKMAVQIINNCNQANCELLDSASENFNDITMCVSDNKDELTGTSEIDASELTELIKRVSNNLEALNANMNKQNEWLQAILSE